MPSLQNISNEEMYTDLREATEDALTCRRAISLGATSVATKDASIYDTRNRLVANLLQLKVICEELAKREMKRHGITLENLHDKI